MSLSIEKKCTFHVYIKYRRHSCVYPKFNMIQFKSFKRIKVNILSNLS